MGAGIKKQSSILPGFNLSLGYTLFYLSLIVLIPISTLAMKGGSLGWNRLFETLSDPRVLASYKLTFSAAFIAAVINAFFGFFIAWFLVRISFPCKNLINSIIDIPFALPTAVSGIALTTVYAPTGWLGKPLMDAGIKIAFTPIGITTAMVFVGIPFVVRTVQPALEQLEYEMEEVALSLGASRWKIFIKVIFPIILPALLTGFAISFARAIGEYGSVVFIAGNMPMYTEIAPLLIITKLEQYDYDGAVAIAIGMLVVSFFLLLTINLLQSWSSRRLRDSH